MYVSAKIKKKYHKKFNKFNFMNKFIDFATVIENFNDLFFLKIDIALLLSMCFYYAYLIAHKIRKKNIIK
jgi:hypothetical protein